MTAICKTKESEHKIFRDTTINDKTEHINMIRRVRSICSIISGSLSYAVGESTGNCPDVRYRWKIVVPVKDLQG